MTFQSRIVACNRTGKAGLWKEKVPNAEIYPISALEGFNVSEVFSRILELLPESPAFYPKDSLTDKPERFFVNEIIREKIFIHCQQEIPYSCQVEVEEYIEEDDITKIRAHIIVERDSQKGILIGKGGDMLRRIGTEARKEIQNFIDKHVYLETFVKVDKDWRGSSQKLKKYGY